MQSLSEQLTAQFYEWEILGRGWILSEDTIDLEPPFTPFFGHHLPRYSPSHDDGIPPTLFNKLVSLFKKNPPIQSEEVLPISYTPYIFDDNNEITVFRILLPKESQIKTVETEQFLIMLSYCISPLSFELTATPEKIFIHFSCRKNYSAYLKSQLHTYFPLINILEQEYSILNSFSYHAPIATADFGLKEEFMRPLAPIDDSQLDSLTGIFSVLEHIKQNERILFQVVFNGVVNPWERSIIESVSDGKGGEFFMDSPEMASMAKEKITSPLFAVTIKVLTQADTLENAYALLDKVAFCITTASRSDGNSLIPLPNQEYTLSQRVQDILFRQSHRVGMLLNVKELATFVHIPNITSKKLLANDRKTKEAPEINGSFILGENEHNGVTQSVKLTNEQRLKHTHIIGATGTGKSTLLLNMIAQDIEADHGLAVLDPHGDLIESILQTIPEKRIQDVVILDPADTEYPLSFNILQAHSEIEKEILSADLVASFRRLSTSWGDQMTSVLSNAILAFLESSREGTLIDLRRFLIEKQYRQDFLKSVNDPNILYYWEKEYNLLKTNSIGPILTRLDIFLRSRIIRNMVAQKKGLDFDNILNTKKILLIKLSQGLIGNENSYMLGTFIVSKIHQAAFARQALQTRNDFYLYVDEFQHFITPSMAAILSGARKYHLGLILAHQDLQQLQKYDSELSNSIISNAGTRICFRLGDIDAKRLAEGFSFFEAQDLQNLNTGEAIARIEKSGNDFSLSITPIELQENKQDIDLIISTSRENYTTPKAIVESQLFNDLNFQEERKTETNSEQITIAPVKKKVEQVAPAPEQEILPVPIIDSKEVETIIKKKVETQHRYLQNLIKKMAEARGFKTTLEAPIPSGNGKVDVLLERDSQTIACEISVTTDISWEIHNIQKCLEAGYDVVVSCQTDIKSLTQLQAKAAGILNGNEISKVKFFTPESLFSYLDEITVSEIETETMMKGYRVKVTYDAITSEEMDKKRSAVAKVVADSIKKIDRSKH